MEINNKLPPFTINSTAIEVARDIRLDGLNIVITGANTGIGKECARVFYKMGGNVFIVGRSVDKCNAAKEDILKQDSNPQEERLHVLQCDLASFKSIREFGAEWENLNLPLHILLNNAGIMACPCSTTVDGFETQFGVNHLGHFLLTHLLLPSLKRAGKARVVNVSSLAHNGSDIRFDVCGKTDIYKEMFGDWKAYSISKTANILFSNELDRRYKGEGIRSNSLHPGIINTDLGRHSFLVSTFHTIANYFCKTTEQGAATSVLACTAPELEDVGGKYLSDCQLATPKSYTNNEEHAKQLWELSMKWVGLSEE
jgi:retinol dehydrogenase-12